jgi:hypothetical protein
MCASLFSVWPRFITIPGPHFCCQVQYVEINVFGAAVTQMSTHIPSCCYATRLAFANRQHCPSHVDSGGRHLSIPTLYLNVRVTAISRASTHLKPRCEANLHSQLNPSSKHKKVLDNGTAGNRQPILTRDPMLTADHIVSRHRKPVRQPRQYHMRVCCSQPRFDHHNNRPPYRQIARKGKKRTSRWNHGEVVTIISEYHQLHPLWEGRQRFRWPPQSVTRKEVFFFSHSAKSKTTKVCVM